MNLWMYNFADLVIAEISCEMYTSVYSHLDSQYFIFNNHTCMFWSLQSLVLKGSLTGFYLQELKERVAHICVAIHNSVAEIGVRYWQEVRRHYYATPSSYMELIRLYARMLRDNKREFISNR